MSYQAGDTYPATLTVRDADGVLTDPDSLVLRVRDNEGTVTTYTYGEVGSPIVRDSLGVFHADVPLTAAGMWVISWETSNEEQVEGVQVSVSPAPTASVTFATLAELALRLGHASPDDMTAAQQAQGQMLLELVTGLIVDAVDKTDTWAATLYPIHRALRAVCLEATARVMQNPSGMSSESETLGAYSHTTRYESTGNAQASGLALTEEEMRLCRKAVWGTVSGSSYPIAALSAD